MLKVGRWSYESAANEPISPFILSVFCRYSESTVQPTSAKNWLSRSRMSLNSTATCSRTTSNAAVYETLHHGAQNFNTDEPLSLLNQIFRPMEEDHLLVKSFTRKIKDLGISGESFQIVPENIPKPRKRKLETLEDVNVGHRAHFGHDIAHSSSR